MRHPVKYLFSPVALMLHANIVLASDSYRYLHVSIDTPWAIFVFLLFIVLFPFVLSAILYWHFTVKKHKSIDQQQDEPESSIEEKKS